MKPRHTNADVCSLCEEKLQGVHPYMAQWVRRVRKSYPNTHVSWGFRGKDDQDLFYQRGSSKAQWPNSSHNRHVPIDPAKPFSPGIFGPNSRPESKAVDLFQIDPHGRAYWNPMFFGKLNEEIEKLSLPIQWAGKWKTFKETCHFEMK